ncbi:MAG TPA: N-acetylmuramoyl-L-alanine amidase [Sunxiuqinia sp.]|nr:N-acetylmuramoyl-L-alanine amidase [Sunxiuqinia sp.]
MNISLKLNIVLLIAFFLGLSPIAAKNAPNKPFTVIIDPGHGGKDPGASYKHIKEKNVVLKIGLKLGDYIHQYLPDVRVIFTRDKDVFVPLHQRADIANNHKADLFISLHANFCGAPSITGTETYVLGLHRTQDNLEVAKKENSVILMEDDYTERYEGFDPNSSESYIMFEMVQDQHLNQSINFAADIQSQFKSRAKRLDRGVKQAGFLVLRETSMPSVLIETGFLSNPYEARYLNSDDGEAYLASAIYRAVREYKHSIDAKSDYKLLAPQTADKTSHRTVIKPKMVDQSTNDEINFRLQLAATAKMIEPSAANFKGLNNVERTKMKSTYKYYYGKTKSFKAIQKLKNKVKKLFPDAFIVAFDGDDLVSIRKALRKINR